MGYSSFLSLVGVASFNVEYHHGWLGIDGIPDALGGLADPSLSVQLFEARAEEGIKKSGFAWALRADDGERMIGFI